MWLGVSEGMVEGGWGEGVSEGGWCEGVGKGGWGWGQVKEDGVKGWVTGHGVGSG